MKNSCESKSEGVRLLEENTPALILYVLISLSTGAMLVAQAWLQQSLNFVNHIFLGYDFTVFYRAAMALLHGQSPYSIPDYVFPPLPALLIGLMASFDFEHIKHPLAVAVALSVVASLCLTFRTFNPWFFGLRYKFFTLVAFALILSILSLSYPFMFLLERCNIDGFVLLSVCLGVFLLGKSDALSGVFFALAISLKVYPLLVILPLATSRRWKALAFLCGTMLFLYLLTPQLWNEFITERILRRASVFRIDENGSLMNAFLGLGFFLEAISGADQGVLPKLMAKMAFPVYALLLAAVTFFNLTKRNADPDELRADVLMYVPFMVAVPNLAFHYELVGLLAMLPAISWHWKLTSQPAERMTLVFISAGIAIAQFQAVAAYEAIGSVHAHFVPAIGLFIVLAGIFIFKLRRTLRSARGIAAERA